MTPFHRRTLGTGPRVPARGLPVQGVPAQGTRTPTGTPTPTGTGAHAAELRAAAAHLGRRRFLTGTAAAAALAFAVNLPTAGVAGAAQLDARKITEDPFTLGVASGDPRPDGVLLWTRLAPSPYEPDSGLPPNRVSVRWELAHDARFTRIVKRGSADAHPEFHHSVHVDVPGLGPDRVYYFRFRVGEWVSPVGRTRTAPARGARIGELKFAASPARRTTTATSPPTGISRRRTSMWSSISATICTSTP